MPRAMGHPSPKRERGNLLRGTQPHGTRCCRPEQQCCVPARRHAHSSLALRAWTGRLRVRSPRRGTTRKPWATPRVRVERPPTSPERAKQHDDCFALSGLWQRFSISSPGRCLGPCPRLSCFSLSGCEPRGHGEFGDSGQNADAVFPPAAMHIPRSRFGLGPGGVCPNAPKGQNKTASGLARGFLVSAFQAAHHEVVIQCRCSLSGVFRRAQITLLSRSERRLFLPVRIQSQPRRVPATLDRFL